MQLRTKNSNTLLCATLLSFEILLLTLVPATHSHAVITFEKAYGGTSSDMGFSVQETSDRGYVIVGYTHSFGAGRFDVYLVKVDSLGDTLWTRTYGGSGLDAGYSVQETPDGELILVGRTHSFGVGGDDVYLIKTSFLGDTLWTRTYGGTGFDMGRCVRYTQDGGYVIAGYTESFGVGYGDVYLIKTDSLGDTMWTRTYGGTQSDYGWSVEQTLDGGYVIAGHTESFGAGVPDAYLVKTDSLGDTMWTKTYGNTDADLAFSGRETSDKGYIITGCTGSFGVGSYDVYLIKTDSLGDTMWTRTYGGPLNDRGFSVQQTQDQGYIIAGYTWSFGAGVSDILLIKTDSLGDTIWTSTYGGSSFEYARSVQRTADGGYIIAGTTASSGAGYLDVYLIKTDSMGLVGMCEPMCLKENVLAELDTLNPQSKHVAKGIKKAKKHIEKSLESKRWLDETHLHHKHGKKVFYEEKKAVKDIRKLCKKRDFPDELCDRLIGMLLEADSILARVAIDDAIAAGGKKKEIEKAEKEMAKAEKEKKKEKYDKAVDHYKKAWQHAIKAVKHHKANQTERTNQPSRSRSLTNP